MVRDAQFCFLPLLSPRGKAWCQAKTEGRGREASRVISRVIEFRRERGFGRTSRRAPTGHHQVELLLGRVIITTFTGKITIHKDVRSPFVGLRFVKARFGSKADERRSADDAGEAVKANYPTDTSYLLRLDYNLAVRRV